MSNLISVVMPARNVGSYIGSSITSILKQDLNELEVIVVDDSSTDSTAAVVEATAKSDRRVRLVSNTGAGLIAALNCGVAAARGAWIARMDGDDLSVPSRFTEQLHACTSAKARLCGSFVRTFGATIPRTRRYCLSPEAIRRQLLFNTAFAHPVVFGDIRLFRDNPYDPAAKFLEDYELWSRLAAKDIHMINLPRVLLRYRKSSGQITTKYRQDQDYTRLRIAESYRAATAPDFPADVLATIHDRTGTCAPSQTEVATEYLCALAERGEDVENIYRSNLFKFLFHNAITVPWRTCGPRLSRLLTSKQMATLKMMKVLRLSPLRENWRQLYRMT